MYSHNQYSVQAFNPLRANWNVASAQEYEISLRSSSGGTAHLGGCAPTREHWLRGS